MDVRIETQRRGIVQSIPAPGDGHESVARGSNQPRSDSHPQTKPPSGAPATLAAAASGATGAWFDANGDGVIESWSYSHGGDSFANFTPPPPRSSEPSSRKSNDAALGPATARPGDRADANAGTTAQVHKAHTAYRRDGLSNEPAARHADTPAPAPAPAAAPPVPVPTKSGTPSA